MTTLVENGADVDQAVDNALSSCEHDEYGYYRDQTIGRASFIRNILVPFVGTLIDRFRRY